MSSKTSERIRALVCMAMLCALAVAADIFLRIPNIGGFLTYEPKEVILTIGGFIFGPIAGIAMSLWISSESTVTPCARHISPILAMVRRSQSCPVGFWGLQKMRSFTAGSAALARKSSKSISKIRRY